MNLGLLNIEYCPFCTNDRTNCYCFRTAQNEKVFHSIMQYHVKKRKFATAVCGINSVSDFRLLKNRLGTGGTYSDSKCTFRGKISSRLIKVLKELGYRGIQ